MPFIISAGSSLKTEPDKRIAQAVMTVHGGIEEGETPPPILAQGHSQEQQETINLAWEVSNGDMRFLYLLTAENGEYSHDRVHPKQAGTIGTDHGYCGINDYYHRRLVLDPRFLNDKRWQMQQCFRLYKEGTTFWGLRRFDTNSRYHQKILNKFKNV